MASTAKKRNPKTKSKSKSTRRNGKTSTTLLSKQGEITERNAALFQRRVQDEVDALNERIQEGNQELRGIRVARRVALEQEENRVRFAVLGWMPTVVLLLGLVLYVRRTRQERQAKRGT